MSFDEGGDLGPVVDLLGKEIDGQREEGGDHGERGGGGSVAKVAGAAVHLEDRVGAVGRFALLLAHVDLTGGNVGASTIPGSRPDASGLAVVLDTVIPAVTVDFALTSGVMLVGSGVFVAF